MQSVARIYAYFKQQGIATEVMGASFRNIGQIQALAGCDLLTISPDLLAQLQKIDAPLQRALDPKAAAEQEAVRFDEAGFRYALNEDAMATEKLAEGIRLFAADAVKLEKPDRGQAMRVQRCDRTTAWQALQVHYQVEGQGLRSARGLCPTRATVPPRFT